MDTSSRKTDNTRIEFRVSKQDKKLFENASAIRGYKSFSEFARVTIAREARAIVEEENKVLASQRDRKIFFDALMGKEEKPNEALVSAITDYKQAKKNK